MDQPQVGQDAPDHPPTARPLDSPCSGAGSVFLAPFFQNGIKGALGTGKAAVWLHLVPTGCILMRTRGWRRPAGGDAPAASTDLSTGCIFIGWMNGGQNRGASPWDSWQLPLPVTCFQTQDLAMMILRAGGALGKCRPTFPSCDLSSRVCRQCGGEQTVPIKSKSTETLSQARGGGACCLLPASTGAERKDWGGPQPGARKSHEDSQGGNKCLNSFSIVLHANMPCGGRLGREESRTLFQLICRNLEQRGPQVGAQVRF